MRLLLVLAALATSGCSAMSLGDPRENVDRVAEPHHCETRARTALTGTQMNRDYSSVPLVEVVCERPDEDG